MKENKLQQIEAEMALAGTDPKLHERLRQLEAHRITPDMPLKPMRFLFSLFGTPCFPRGELVAITGKAKSGKTFVTSMLMAKGFPSSVTDAIPCLQRNGDKPLRMLWLDTEQSEESTQDILKNRILPMMGCGKDKQAPLHWGVAGGEVFNMRSEPWQQRMPLLEVAVQHCKPDMVVVDGIRDLVNDINDGCLAQEVVERLMQLASESECCIVCVLHQNKGSDDHNLRGWIGTELTNKAFEVYACEKDANRVFSLCQTHTRKYDIVQNLYFTVDSDGLPRQVGTTNDSGEPAKRLGLNHDFVIGHGDGSWEMDIVQLFCQAFHEGETEVSGAELRERVMTVGNISHFHFYNKLLSQAIEQKVIEKSQHNNHVVYRLAPF